VDLLVPSLNILIFFFNINILEEGGEEMGIWNQSSKCYPCMNWVLEDISYKMSLQIICYSQSIGLGYIYIYMYTHTHTHTMTISIKIINWLWLDILNFC
jgi:hypothetical protein